MKFFPITLLVLATGCIQQTAPPSHDPSRLFQDKLELAKAPAVEPVIIEINSVPPPFNLGGDNPYAVWMNGRKVNLPKEDLITLVNKVGRNNIPEIDPTDIHKGWLWPHLVKRDESFDGQRLRR